MLSPRAVHASCKPLRGFSLIEMMIAMVIGLFVIASVLGMLLAINQSNSETIQSTRLTQELRALTSVIASDIKRSRRVDDPIAKVGQGALACAATAAHPCFGIGPTPTADPACITYGYSGTSGNAGTNNYRAISRDVDAAGVGSIVLATGTAAVTCDTAGTKLNSDQVDITGMCIAYNTGTVDAAGALIGTTCPVCTTSACTCSGGAAGVPTVGTGEVDVCIAAKLRDGDSYSRLLVRSISQPIFIRSISAQ